MRRWALRVRACMQGDAGIGLIELVTATGLMAIAVVGVMSALGLGGSVVAMSRHRTSAATVAAERIERIRQMSYDLVALQSAPVHVDDETNPDSAIGLDGTYTGESFVTATDGAVAHKETETRGPTTLDVYHYVTWPPASGNAYKRVTVVVTWPRTSDTAVNRNVTMSTFVGNQYVVVNAATPSPPPSATPPPASPSPTVVPMECAADPNTVAPSGTMEIVSGTGAEIGYTSSLSVQVRLNATDDCPGLTAELSNDGSTFALVATSVGTATTMSSTAAWTIPPGDGTKMVYGRFVDQAGNTSSVFSQSIVLDQTHPTIAADLRESICSTQSTMRQTTLTWNPSTDQHLLGYRLYRSDDGAAYASVATTTAASHADNSDKSKVVRYVVRAYDRAGNESPDSNVITYAKNTC